MDYKTVHDLNAEELLELKYAYHDQLQYTDDADIFRSPEDIPDDVIFDHYAELTFAPYDFWCNCTEDEEPSYWYVGI